MNKKQKMAQRMPKEELLGFLMRNHAQFTIAELAEKSGWSRSTVISMCETHSVVPISLGERSKKLISENIHLTVRELAALTTLSEGTVRQYLSDLKITAAKDYENIPVEQKLMKQEEKIARIRASILLGPIARKYMEVPMVDLVNKVKYGTSG